MIIRDGLQESHCGGKEISLFRCSAILLQVNVLFIAL